MEAGRDRRPFVIEGLEVTGGQQNVRIMIVRGNKGGTNIFGLMRGRERDSVAIHRSSAAI